jgi:hypothetical protein
LQLERDHRADDLCLFKSFERQEEKTRLTQGSFMAQHHWLSEFWMRMRRPLTSPNTALYGRFFVVEKSQKLDEWWPVQR